MIEKTNNEQCLKEFLEAQKEFKNPEKLRTARPRRGPAGPVAGGVRGLVFRARDLRATAARQGRRDPQGGVR